MELRHTINKVAHRGSIAARMRVYPTLQRPRVNTTYFRVIIFLTYTSPNVNVGNFPR